MSAADIEDLLLGRTITAVIAAQLGDAAELHQLELSGGVRLRIRGGAECQPIRRRTDTPIEPAVRGLWSTFEPVQLDATEE
jgi:hypothetical protein